MTIVIVFFFFFQAEDGIRDVAVTGVQTCALPIYPGLCGRVAAVVGGGAWRSRDGDWRGRARSREVGDREADGVGQLSDLAGGEVGCGGDAWQQHRRDGRREDLSTRSGVGECPA